MIRAKLKCENPGDIEFTITVTMAAKDWEKLRDQMLTGQSESWPAWEFKAQINDVLSQASKTYTAASPAKKGKTP